MKLLISALLFTSGCWAAPAILSISPTPMQAVVVVQSTQPSTCTIAASRGGSIGTSIPDIVVNGNSTARFGTITNGQQVSFVLGTRTANNALAANAMYTVQATCGDGTSPATSFQTKPVQWGNTAPDVLPYNSAKFGNMDHPAIDFNGTAAANTFCDGKHSYCDPNTGTEYFKVTQPGWALQAAIEPAAFVGAWGGTPIDLSGTGKFTNPANISFHASSPSAFTTATGGATDKLFVPFSQIGCPQGGGAWSGFTSLCTIDDISFSVWCGNATTGGVTGFNLQLTPDGGQTLVGNVITTGNCPSGTPSLLNIYPGGTSSMIPSPIFKTWGYIPKHNMIVPPGINNGGDFQTSHAYTQSQTIRPLTNNAGLFIFQAGSNCTSGTYPGSWNQTLNGTTTDSGGCVWTDIGGAVNVSGTAVTLVAQTQNSTNYFNLDWTTGTPILINGSYAHVASVPSSTTLITQENLGTLTNVNYSGANFGVVITKTNSSSTNVDVSIGLNYAFSPQATQGQNADREMMNKASVQVSRSADGATCGIYTVGCSAGVLNPTIPGYLGVTDNGAIFIWIPRNSDGSPRGEARLLTQLNKQNGSSRVNWNGDTPSSGLQLIGAMAFDDTDGTTVYIGSAFGNGNLWKLSYNETYGGSGGNCIGYQAFVPYGSGATASLYAGGAGSLNDDCFTWNNVTPNAGGHDPKTQIMGSDGVSGAYQTGLNYLGQTVGTAHKNGIGTAFDLGWIGGVGMPDVGSEPPGLVMYNASDGQQHYALYSAFGDDGTGKYIVKIVRDTWSDPGLRWTGNHTLATNMGSMEFVALGLLENTGHQFMPGRHQATVSQVNLAGFGSPTAWTSTTALNSNTNFYTCPTGLPSPYTSLSSTPNCLQVRVTTPPCQVTPGTYTFHDGNNEQTEFPCTTPGFGVADAARSKLGDFQIGDWLCFTDTGSCAPGGQERAVILTSPVYNSANDITFWILRTAGWSYLHPIYNGNDDDETNGVGHSASGQACCTHSGTWGLYEATPQAGVATALDVSSPANNWLLDNPTRFAGHAIAGAGALPGTYSFIQGGLGSSFNSFGGTSNLTAANSVNSPFSLTVAYPLFAGIPQVSAYMQIYPGGTQAPGSSSLPFFTDYKAINPSFPSGQELFNGFGSTFTTTLVGGTSHTYLISADCCNVNANYKKLGVQAFAGRFWTRDVSSPTTFGSAADLPNYSVCWARNANECVFGSTAGKLYVSFPQRDVATSCTSSNFGNAYFCLSSFGPLEGQAIQFRNDLVDKRGTSYRKFGFSHVHIGLGYTFSNVRPTPDAGFVFSPGYWADGVRTDWYAYRIDGTPPVDTIDRTQFVNVPVQIPANAIFPNARIRFGYAENGGDLLHCTPYAADCSTETVTASPTDPFSFLNESRTLTACASGCTINIPALPNRVVYYIVDRLDSSGNVLTSDPGRIIAVP